MITSTWSRYGEAVAVLVSFLKELSNSTMAGLISSGIAEGLFQGHQITRASSGNITIHSLKMPGILYRCNRLKVPRAKSPYSYPLGFANDSYLLSNRSTNL